MKAYYRLIDGMIRITLQPETKEESAALKWVKEAPFAIDIYEHNSYNRYKEYWMEIKSSVDTELIK